MDKNLKTSRSLKIYWQKAIARRIQLSNKMKGKSNPAKSIIARTKISESKQGKHWKRTHAISEKQRLHLLKLAKLKIGKRHSFETRIKISLSRKGKCRGTENPFYGRHHTKSSIKKIKISHRFRRNVYLNEIRQKAKKLGFIFNTNLKEDKTVDNWQRNNGRINPMGYIVGTIPTDAYFGKLPNKNYFVYSISAKDKDFIEYIIDCFKEAYGLKINLNKYRNLFRIQTSKKQILKFLKFLKKEKDNQWVFSKKIFHLNKNFHRSLLIAVSDAEGCVANSRLKDNLISRKITITNSSLALLKQIKLLLESFGIYPYIYHHRGPRIVQIHAKAHQFKRHVFVLIITGFQNLQKFKDIIGFCIKRKQSKLENILESYKKINHYYTSDMYNLVLSLNKYFSCGDIARLTNLPSYTVRNWVLYNIKPRSVKMKQLI